jgi:cyclophilin family peptidyl-prolyl cis-trans isomerase
MKRAIILFLNACALASQTPAPPAAPDSRPKPPQAAREPGLYATIRTSMGPIIIQLFEKEAPVTVRNFVALARGSKAWTDPKTGQAVKRPLYPGVVFHRVIPGFMVQVGDPTGTGAGDVGFTIKDEFDPSLTFDRPGRVGMANAGPGTGSSQFFVTEVPTPHLNGKHTIFGQVVEGQEVVNQIARVPRGPDDKPDTPIKIVSVTIKREGPLPAAPAKPTARKAAPAKKAAPPAAARPRAKRSAPVANKPAAPAPKK